MIWDHTEPIEELLSLETTDTYIGKITKNIPQYYRTRPSVNLPEWSLSTNDASDNMTTKKPSETPPYKIPIRPTLWIMYLEENPIWSTT